MSLYDRLGGHAGLREVVVDFVGRLGADPKINGYFLNRSVDTDHLVTCLVAQLGAATGGPEVYPDPALGCRDMATAHQGLGISTQDFDDLLGHLVDALTAAGAAPADIATIAAVLQPMADDVVEDPGNDATVYQRVGRKPAIAAVVTDFEARVAADDRVNGFFATVTDFTRLHACLTRQVCGIDGPCRYGEEEAAEFAPLVNQAPCRSMAETHVGLMSGASVITIDDFNAIAENLVAALTAAGVATGDIDAIVGAIAPLCDQIVAGGVGCAP
ncbi:MAG: group 1 truncated hemoglobin [Kofleriaceae bacterium]|nr:group 1 truncated hemoglobin [Kofleriaceae bacterium]